MAPQLTSAERQETYQQLFLLNRAFHFITERLRALGKTGVLNSRDLKDMLGLSQEVQLEVNTAVLNMLESIEQGDHAHFGKVRIALEKRLRGPEPKPRKKARPAK